VIFKDYVNEINNETIVFHEPSNRWICYMDLDQTPPFHNEFLEPTYEITQGFEGGIGYSFDEDTRFAMFDIQAANNRTVIADTIGMTMTPYAPTPLDESAGTQDNIGLSATIYAPTVHISYIILDTYFLEWNYDQYGWPERQMVTVTTTEPSVVVSEMPVWMTGRDSSGNTIVAGVTTVTNGDYIYLYPASQATDHRQDQVEISDSFGNVSLIYVRQYAEPI
jgi:hypothetical protein